MFFVSVSVYGVCVCVVYVALDWKVNVAQHRDNFSNYCTKHKW